MLRGQFFLCQLKLNLFVLILLQLNSADPGEMPHYVVFCPDLPCFPK